MITELLHIFFTAPTLWRQDLQDDYVDEILWRRSGIKPRTRGGKAPESWGPPGKKEKPIKNE